jgi:SAM-dependent methyltransferase
MADETGTSLIAFVLERLRRTSPNADTVILDFGCGAGGVVAALRRLGFSRVFGCDPKDYWSEANAPRELFRVIQMSPFRIPFDDSSFDVIVSTSVLEHAQNPHEYLPEMYRVLKPGGIMIHVLPGCWCLPTEPHQYVPLVNWFWPRVPDWWLLLWAKLGIRNEHQQGMDAASVVLRNRWMNQNNMFYPRHREYRRWVTATFGNCSFPNALFVEHYPPRATWKKAIWDAVRSLGLFPLIGWIRGRFKMGLLVAIRERQDKTAMQRAFDTGWLADYLERKSHETPIPITWTR